ncbi:MAG: hypothetical protein SF069_15470 [Phycisphaerae bacterium]|nr:hypothetical protein [Phycisphaerae bacterium]
MFTLARLLKRGMFVVALCGVAALARGDPLVIWTSQTRGVSATNFFGTQSASAPDFRPFSATVDAPMQPWEPGWPPEGPGTAHAGQRSEFLTSPDGFFAFVEGDAGGPGVGASEARVNFTLTAPSDYTVYANYYPASGVATDCYILFRSGTPWFVWSYEYQMLYGGGVMTTSGTLPAGDYEFEISGGAYGGHFAVATWLLIPEPAVLIAVLLLVPALLCVGRR